MNIKIDIAVKKDALIQLRGQIENCYVNLDIDFDPVIKDKYDRLVGSFKKLITSAKIWDVTAERFEDRKVTRSAASTVVNKREVRFGIKAIAEIKSQLEPLWFKNANGADLYFYPHFIVMYSSKKDFALVGLDEINFSENAVRFVETGTIPKDSKVIDRTWTKVNKNGTPDKRFKDNRQIPIVRYGEITLKTNTCLNEEYQFSNYEYSEEFATSFCEFQNIIRSLKPLRGQLNKILNQ